MRLVFRYEAEKEFLNLQAGNRSLNRSRPSDFSRKLKELGVDINSEVTVTAACRKIVTEEGISAEEKIRQFSDGWQAVDTDVFERLTKLFEAQNDDTEFACYLSLNERCSYNTQEDYFFLNLFSAEPNMVCIHELLHLFTHKYIKLNISPQLYNEYKESLTVLLNLEFGDLIEREDKGYLQHQEVRQYIASKWDEGTSIISLTHSLLTDQKFLELLSNV
ncbi:MAG: hypothetical protein NUV80_03260 [Candidatus Berkelbacteria bacterium]|nr:hypothetical protein [Candidatus Berkelbacteria bacterium]MCR4307553.1 hypothetical protein [Candidatus Berkelbacteria bacterium]